MILRDVDIDSALNFRARQRSLIDGRQPSTCEFLLNPYRFGGSLAASTVSLLNFQGSNGSTTFTDQTGRVWTGTGNAQISTAQFIQGSSSLAVDGTGDWISTTDTSAFRIGTGDFTVEAYIRLTGTGAQQIFAHYSSASGQNGGIGFNVDASRRVQGSRAGVAVVATGATTIGTGAWHHVAMTRQGGGTNNVKLWLDGVMDGQATYAGSWSDTGTSPFSAAGIGAIVTSGASAMNGWVGAFRFSNVALYSSTFTPTLPWN